MNIEIDEHSGFCFGVVHAIRLAEKTLKDGNLYCLGDIVHNEAEIQRLEKLGLTTIETEQLKTLQNCRVMIRAHGEPPETYKIAQLNNIEIIDATCPVVLKLQNKIKIGYEQIKQEKGQVVIYGQKGHAEVNGLVGQTGGKAIVVSELTDIEQIDFSRPVYIFSQTTKSPALYSQIINEIREKKISIQGNDSNFIVNYSICGQVSNRYHKLREFSKKHDIILFVSGNRSSNGRMLYNICKNENSNTFFVSESTELQKEWFINTGSVGICGATSTPQWLMQDVYNTVVDLS